jgi:zinc protease
MSNVLVRERAIIVSAGPLSAEAAGQVIDRLLAGLPKVAPSGTRAATELRNGGRLVVLEKPGIAQTSIAAGGPTKWVSGVDLMAGTLGTRVLGGDFNSRLNSVVRGKLGATYGIGARLSSYDPKSYALSVTSAVDNVQAKAAIDAIRATYATFLGEGITAAEFEAQRTKYRQELRDRDTKAQSTANTAFVLLMAGLPLDMMVTQQARLNALTVSDVNRLISEKMAQLPLTIAVVAPSAEGLGADCVIRALEELDTCR